MKYRPIIGTIGYILSKDKKKVLLVHRTGHTQNDHLGKYTGLGGKMHSNENVLTCIKREIKEESNLDCTNIILRGTINWTGFGKKEEDWLGFVFLITDFEGTPNQHSPEGPLEWLDLEKILDVPIWEGDRYFLPLVFDNDPRIFHGFMPYKNGSPVEWKCERL